LIAAARTALQQSADVLDTARLLLMVIRGTEQLTPDELDQVESGLIHARLTVAVLQNELRA
jgi:hypothetical protein